MSRTRKFTNEFARLHAASLGTTLSGFAAQAFLIVSGVLVARLLPVDERGQLALLGLLPIIICQLGGLGIPLAVTYELASRPASARSVAAVLGRLMPLQAVVLMLVHVLTLLAFFQDDGAIWKAALVTLPAVPALLYQYVGLGVLQGQQRFTAFNVLRLMPIAVYAGVLVMVAVTGIESLLACAACWSGAWLLGALVTMRLAMPALRRTEGDAAVNRKAFLRFGRRGVLGSVFPVEAFQLDQLIVAILFAPAALGLYVVALAFTNLPRFIAHSLGMVAYPRIAAASDRRSGTRALWRSVALAMAFIAPLVIVLELTIEWLVPFFFGEAYAGAASVARVLLIAALFQSARRILADAARGQGHPELGTVAEIASWLVLVPAIIVFESRGLEGIAVAMTVTYGASLVVLIVAVGTRVGQPPKADRGVANSGAPTSATGELPG